MVGGGDLGPRFGRLASGRRLRRSRRGPTVFLRGDGGLQQALVVRSGPPALALPHNPTTSGMRRIWSPGRGEGTMGLSGANGRGPGGSGRAHLVHVSCCPGAVHLTAPPRVCSDTSLQSGPIRNSYPGTPQ